MPDINHPRALLPAWQAEAERLQQHLDEHGRFDQDQPADILTAVLLTRMRALDELRGQLTRRLEWSGMLDP